MTIETKNAVWHVYSRILRSLVVEEDVVGDVAAFYRVTEHLRVLLVSFIGDIVNLRQDNALFIN